MDPWILSEGVKLARSVTDPATKAGFQVTLGGSVLLSGKSAKDVDLFFIPKSKNSSPAELVTELEKLWGAGTRIDLKFEERTRRMLEEEEEAINNRFNPQQVPRTSTRVSGRFPTSPADAQENVAGYPVMDNEPGDMPYRGGPTLPPGYHWATQLRSGRTVVVRDVDSDGSTAWGSIANAVVDSSPERPKKKVENREPFRLALMFQRGDDRIDAFIV